MLFRLTAIGVLSFGLFAQAVVTRISGEVNIDGADPASRYTVELIDPSRHQPVERTLVAPNGRFDFAVPGGDYELRLVSSTGEMLQIQSVHIGSISNSIELRASVKRIEHPVEGVISAARLRHHPPSKAVKEFRKAAETQDTGAAIVHLQKAVAIDPEFMEAHHDLGCKYLRAGNTAGAMAELEHAVQLDPGSSRAFANLALVYLRASRFPDAEQAAKRSFALDGQSAVAHYALGLARFAEHRYDSETLRHLELAREQYPYAEKPAAALRSVMSNSFVHR